MCDIIILRLMEVWMAKVSNEFNEYITQVSLDFIKYTHNLAGLAIAEAKRQKNIRLEWI